MHPFSFRLKRAHQRVVLLGGSILREFGLTPARFDLLFLVHERLNDAPTQTELSRALGVTAATVSRMVRSLEELGIVMRFHVADRRAKHVALTEGGIALFREASWHAFGDLLSQTYQSAFGKPSAWIDLVVTKLAVQVEKIARAFGDTSALLTYGFDDD
jgi:DNA-binding MarR family transcriptional regulator